MKRIFALTALCLALQAQAQTTAAPAAAPVSQAKKELVQKLLALQQPVFENIARNVVERPAVQLMQAAGQALQTQIPVEKRESTGKTIETDVKKFVEDSVPLLRERALKLAPSTFGTVFEEKFTEDELKQLIAWTESPVNKKFKQTLPDVETGFVKKLIGEAGPLLDPKLQELQQKVRATLTANAGSATAPAASAPAPARAAKPPAKAASK
ncbi:MAG: hypothetical protein ACKVOX_10400 [Rhizobacter sp.]